MNFQEEIKSQLVSYGYIVVATGHVHPYYSIKRSEDDDPQLHKFYTLSEVHTFHNNGKRNEIQ